MIIVVVHRLYICNEFAQLILSLVILFTRVFTAVLDFHVERFYLVVVKEVTSFQAFGNLRDVPRLCTRDVCCHEIEAIFVLVVLNLR